MALNIEQNLKISLILHNLFIHFAKYEIKCFQQELVHFSSSTIHIKHMFNLSELCARSWELVYCNADASNNVAVDISNQKGRCLSEDLRTTHAGSQDNESAFVQVSIKQKIQEAGKEVN
jgi:hypothetical protein